jgi:poly(A) polymerase Pap1
MAAPPARQWGVTPPISTILPTQDELAANDDLIAELKAQNNFELPSETERRCVTGIKEMDPGEVSEQGANDENTESKSFSFSSASRSSSLRVSVERKGFPRLP